MRKDTWVSGLCHNDSECVLDVLQCVWKCESEYQLVNICCVT